VAKLLDLHADLDGTHPVRDEETGLTERWPVWVVVSIALMQCLLSWFSSIDELLTILRDLGRINMYAIDQGWNAAITFEAWPQGWSQHSKIPYESRQINIGEVVRFGQTLNHDLRVLPLDASWLSFFLGSGSGIEGNFSSHYEIHRVTWGSDKQNPD
jgi:hypothetical protein